MCGLPFSGKSTLSRQISEYLKIPRISFDEVWVEVEVALGKIPGANSIEQWKYIINVCEQKVVDSLKSGQSVVYDNLGDRFEHRDRVARLATKNNAESLVIYLDVTKDEVISRRQQNLQSQERHQVSDENFNQALLVFEPPTDTEKVLAYKPTMNTKRWLIMCRANMN